MNSENATELKKPVKDQVEVEKPKPAQPETPKTPSLPVSSLIGFNTEDFLARVNMNEKINNILRSPTKTPNGVRQRSVFTAITPSSVSWHFCFFQFTLSAFWFISLWRSAGNQVCQHCIHLCRWKIICAYNEKKLFKCQWNVRCLKLNWLTTAASWLSIPVFRSSAHCALLR